MTDAQEVRVIRYFDGRYKYLAVREDGSEHEVTFPSPNVSARIAEINQLAETLRTKLTTHVSRLPAFAPALAQATAHIDQFVQSDFTDYEQLANLVKTFATALKGLPGQDQAIQEDIAATTRELQVKHSEIQQAHNIDALAIFQRRLPHFLFHSTLLDRIPNEVNVGEFIKDAEATSKGMANLCSVAGLSTQKIKELTSSTDTSRREVYEDHYRASISGGINEFWTQETYNVHFRIEREKLSVSISDKTYSPRIPPSDRSDGFQWYLSFFSALLSEVSATDPTVLLLDNPGLELHADGQRDIKRFLEEKLPATTQVMYVTHSPAMIDPYNLEQVKKVELLGEMKGTKVVELSFKADEDLDLFEPVRSAIGASIVNSLIFNEFNVLVEGAADKPILEGAFLLTMQDKAKKILVNGSVSESKSGFLPRFYQRASLPFVVYLDGDSRGRELAASLRSWSILDKVIVEGRNVFSEISGDFELEDILGPEFYHRAVLQTYPGQPVDLPPAGEGKRTRRYESIYKERYGFGFNKRRVGESIKKMLADGKGDAPTIGALEKVTSAIWEALQVELPRFGGG